MRIYALDYYTEFACTADACRHNCCIGWEIDVDADTYARYKNTAGAFGARLRAHMQEDGDSIQFCLGENERCPFLNRDNLCDIIIEMREDALCQICTDHPRYRTFFVSRTEIGLGLCCEAACALILGKTEKPEFVCIAGDEEDEPSEEESLFFRLRADLLDMIFDASCTAEQCMEGIAARYGITLPDVPWAAVYDGFEILHADWRERIKELARPKTEIRLPDAPVKQLLSYFICRHMADGLADGRYRARIAFALHAARVIMCLSDSPEALFEVARQYSEEIEYSAENMEALLSMLEE